MAAHPQIQITTNLAAQTVTPASFGWLTILVDEDEGGAGGNSLNGDRYRLYPQATAATLAAADRTAGYITTQTEARITDAFPSTGLKCSGVRVIRYDSGSAETPSQALQAWLDDPDSNGAWALCVDTRVGATQELLQVKVGALSAAGGAKFYAVYQSAEPGILAGTWPANIADLEDNERCQIVYHDTATENFDIEYAAGLIAADPNEISTTPEFNLSNVAQYTTAITEAERDLAKGLPATVLNTFGSATKWADPGNNCNDRPAYELLTADWLDARVTEAIQNLLVLLASRRQKLTLTPDGVSKLRAAISDVMRTAESGESPHIAPGQWSVTIESFTSADYSARRFRVTINGQIATGGRLFVITTNFSLDPVVSAA